MSAVDDPAERRSHGARLRSVASALLLRTVGSPSASRTSAATALYICMKRRGPAMKNGESSGIDRSASSARSSSTSVASRYGIPLTQERRYNGHVDRGLY